MIPSLSKVQESAGPLRGHQAVGGEDLVETWMTLYPSLHVFTTLIHAVSDTSRGLDAPFTTPCQGSLSSASPAQPVWPPGWPSLRVRPPCWPSPAAVRPGRLASPPSPGRLAQPSSAQSGCLAKAAQPGLVWNHIWSLARNQIWSKFAPP